MSFGLRKWLFLGIILLASVLRLWKIDSFPPLLTQDEASIGYNAWSIAETGRDEWGNKFPLVFEAFGDAKQPVYIYLTALVYKLLGWNVGHVRLVSALAGIVVIFFVEKWVFLRVKDKGLSLMAALIVATSPWAIQLSRMAWESNLALMFLVGGFLFWEKIRQKKTGVVEVIGGGLLLALSTYTYVAYRLVVIGFILLWLVWNRLKKKKTERLKPQILLAVVALILIIPGLMMGKSVTRLQQIGILMPEKIEAIQIDLVNNCHLASAKYQVPLITYVCRGMWNKFTIPVLLIGQSWWQHLNPSFLFFSGDSLVQKNPLQTGSFYAILLPFYFLGIYYAVKKWGDFGDIVLALIVSVLPSVLVGETQAIRLSPHLPFVVMMLVLGIKEVEEEFKVRKINILKILAILLVVMTSLAVPKYAANVFGASQEWLSYGRDIVQVATELSDDGYTVYIDHVMPEPHMFLAYWNQIEPDEYQMMDKAATVDKLGFKRPTKLGEKYVFVLKQNEYQDLVCDHYENEKVAFITNELNSQGFLTHKTITNLNEAHAMAKVYRLDEMLEEAGAKAKFCKGYNIENNEF